MKRIVVTGAKGLLGHHAWAALHAENCAAEFSNAPLPYSIAPLDREAFNDDAQLRDALSDCDVILHFAGVNRGDPDAVRTGNPSIAQRLADHCAAASARPCIVYANSIHAGAGSDYGQSKQEAAEILSAVAGEFINLNLPHIFGEGARPYYNNVTATLIDQLLGETDLNINPDGHVSLLHAGRVADLCLAAIRGDVSGEVTPSGHDLTVPELAARLTDIHEQYTANIFPDLSDRFSTELFNSYRAATYPDRWPRSLHLNSDTRGTLFEAVKGGGGGQCFLSTTRPGVTRGDHFHRHKVERFLVLQGQAVIRVRPIGSTEIWKFDVSGDRPQYVDMPTLHTHSIENTGTDDLLTLFWTNEIFDPDAPDTYADKVLT